MAFINSYKPPAQISPLLTLEDNPYDVNFAFTLPPILESPLVKLIPFIPSQHAERFFDAAKGQDSVFLQLSFPLTTLEEFLVLLEFMRASPTSVLLLIIDKTKADPTYPDLGGSIAGMIGLFGSSKLNMTTEIGPVVILRPFQHTYVSRNAIGLMMHYCLDLPSAGGLGYRRVQWTANPLNLASVKVAEKMGFVIEGTMRWTWILPAGREGKKEREGDPRTAAGRDSVLLAICWDDWEGGVREHVDKLMEKV